MSTFNPGRLVALVAMVVVLGGPALAQGHQSEESEHRTEVRPDSGEVEQLLSIPASDLAHHLGHLGHGEELSGETMEGIRGEIREYIDAHTGVRADDRACEIEESEFVRYRGRDGRVHYRQLWNCPADPFEVEIANRIMFDGHDGYRHVADIQVGEEIYNTVFDRDFPTYEVYPRRPEADRPDESGGTAEPANRQEQEPAPKESDDRKAPEARADNAPFGAMSPLAIAAVASLLLLMAFVVGWTVRRNR